jgi:colanic acid biosynthesis glycosyl transferase WcaI
VWSVLLLSLNYSPEATGFAPHTTALAEHLTRTGHEVTVVTGFPFAPQWARFAPYRGELVREETVNGVHLVRLTHFIPRRPGSALQRLLMEGSFAIAAGVFLSLPRFSLRTRYDVIVYVGAQPALAWLARIIAAVRRAPYVVKVTDLAAQAAVDVGIVGGGQLANVLKRIEFGAYRRARAAIVLCDAFKTALCDQGFPAEDVHVIRDSVDLEAIRPGGDGATFRQRHGIEPDEFVVLYAGSLGLKQGLFDVADAALLLAEDHPRVRWVLVGEGENRKALGQRIESVDMKGRVLLLPLQPEAEMNGMFAAADVLLLSQLRSVKDTVIPSKLLVYMAAGRPILAAVNPESQAAVIIRHALGGVIVAPEDPRALAGAVAGFRTRTSDLENMATRNREYAERHFDRNAIVVAQQRVLERVFDSEGRRRRSAAAAAK